jgi:hypothetical protein
MKSRYGSSMPKLKNPFKKWFIISGGIIVLALLVSVAGIFDAGVSTDFPCFHRER